MCNRSAILWFLTLCSPIPMSFAGAWACDSPEEDAVELAADAFEGCSGFEQPYAEAWFACMDRMGIDRERALERCAGFARALVCHPPMKLPPCKCEKEKKAAQLWEDRVDELRGCYNWTGFIENCVGFASNSELLCEGRTGPGDVCTEDNWRAHKLVQRFGRPTLMPPLLGAPEGPCEKLEQLR